MEDKLKKLVEEFLKMLEITASEIRVEKDENEYYHIDVATDETGLLIGFHGETIQSLELLLKLAAYKQFGEQVKLLLNVGDYREQKEERIKFLADRMIEKLHEHGGEDDVIFPYLSPAERRIVHMYLKDNLEVEAVSEGEGASRRLVLKMKQV
jgi:spoIIIJ-associated protein